MTAIHIRHLESADAPQLKRLYSDAAAYGGTLQLPFPSLDQWTHKLAHPPEGFSSLVAEIDTPNGRDIIGQVGLEICTRPRRRHVAALGIAVRSDHHGKGVGKALMSAILDMADNWLNVRRIELTVFVDNPAAIALYKRFGFELEGSSPAYALRNGQYVTVHHMGRIIEPPIMTS